MSKRKLANVSVDDFFKDDYGNSDEETEEDKEENGDDSGSEETSETPNKKVKISEAAKHRASLKSLQHKDPEFYQFLKESDKDLLNFDVSSSDSENEEERHQLPDKLEVASDDSENEGSVPDDDEEDVSSRGQITVPTLIKWKNQLRKSGPLKTLKLLVKAFRRTVETAVGATGGDAIIEDSGVFNGVIRLCLSDFVPTVNRILKINPAAQKSGEFFPAKKKNWKRIQATVKMYVLDVIKILSTVSEPSVVKALLNHIVQLIPYYTVTPKLSKTLLKKLILIWSTDEESVRVLALVCIARITRMLQDQMLEFVIKNMYMAYVKNCKFTSVSTWATINFMKHSIVEIFALNQSLAYQHAFVYIRQLAIHLRNAITVQKKDSVKTVYNWQYIHCLNLWGQLLCTLHTSEILKPLIYPLVQTTIGTIKLLPATKYIPLRFHCIRLLINICHRTKVFVPVLPLLLEGLKLVDFKQKNSRVSWKPMQFLCMLKLSKLQLTENGFKDAVLDQFYDLMMSSLNTYSHTVGFPELILPPVIELRSFLKTIHVANYAKQIKQLLDKMEENRKFIENKRKSFTGNLADGKAVAALENQIQQHGTPLGKYFVTYRKMRDKEIIQSSNMKEMLDDYDLPVVRRQELIKKQKEKDRVEFKELFDKDDDESSEELDFKIKEEDDDDVSSASENEAENEANEEQSSNEDKSKIQDAIKVGKNKAKEILSEVEKKHGKSSIKQDVLEDFVLSSSASELSDEDE